MKNKLIMTVAVAALVGFSASVQANPITGSVGFTGAYSSSGAINSANDVITFGSTYTFGATDGSFAGIPNLTAVTTAPSITINPLAVPVNGLWSVAGFTFDLTGGSMALGGTASSVTVDGLGTISGNSYDPTAGTWVATFNDQGVNFTWSASTTTVPDGGTTVILLGLALGVCGVFARKLKLA